MEPSAASSSSATDRRDFLARLGRVSTDGKAPILAWSLLPNHFHLLFQSGPTPLSTLMRRLLAGYAVAFNRRHRRRILASRSIRPVVLDARAALSCAAAMRRGHHRPPQERRYAPTRGRSPR